MLEQVAQVGGEGHGDERQAVGDVVDVPPPDLEQVLGGELVGGLREPLHDRVVVKRVTADEKTAGGIIIPDTAKEKPMQGEIVAAGPGARNEKGELVALDVKAGDTVLFGKWSGTEVKLDGQDLLIMKESDILGVVS